MPRLPVLPCRSSEGSRPWLVAAPASKLDFRARLPGASGFDKAAHVLRVLQADGSPASELLSLALPTSWMVNATATSRAFQRWLAPEAAPAWASLFEVVDFGLSPEGWLALPAEARAAAAAAVGSLAAVGEGASLTSVSKVLALLRPQVVPLMDEAAIGFALGAPSTSASSFVPMMDWFAQAVVAEEDLLVALAAAHRSAVLDAAQVLDRLLWFDSAGFRAAERFTQVKDGAREAIVELPRPTKDAAPIDLASADLDAAWVARARAALDGA